MVPPKPSRRRRPGNPRRAVAYLRVSTDEQSLDQQRDAIEAWAFLESVEIVAWCEDLGVSGSTPLDQRDGFLEALGALQEHRAGHLVVAKVDRLARSVMHDAIARLLVEQRGASIVAADRNGNGDEPADVLLRQIVAAFAEYERALIRLRTSAGLRAKRERGLTYTRIPPYGFVNGGRGEPMRPVPEEQRVLRRMLKLRAGGLSIRKVADALNAEGHRQRNGKPWQFPLVQRILARAAPA